MAARVGGFVIDRLVDEADHRFKQDFKPVDQQAIVERHRKLRCQRLDDFLMRVRERDDLACSRIGRIDQLKCANDLVIQRLHRDGQERGRSIAVGLVESARTGEIEPLGIVGIRDVDGLKLVDRVADNLG